MSLDFIYVVNEVERSFGVTLTQEDLNQMGLKRNPPDATVGDVSNMIVEKGGRYYQSNDDDQAAQPACFDCGYSLIGLPRRSRCPECGRAFDLDDTFLILREIVSSESGVPVEQITRESSLFRELGF